MTWSKVGVPVTVSACVLSLPYSQKYTLQLYSRIFQQSFERSLCYNGENKSGKAFFPPRLLVPRNYDLQKYCSNMNTISFVTKKSYSRNWPGSSVGIATTGWTVRDRIPVGTRFFTRPNRPWGPPSLLYNGYRVFPGGKVRPGRAADHSPPSSAAVMEE